MYPYLSFPEKIIKIFKGIGLIASKVKMPSALTNLHKNSNKFWVLLTIHIISYMVLIVSFIFVVKGNIVIAVICFNLILILIGIINFVEPLKQLLLQSTIRNNHQLYKKSILARKELMKNLAINTKFFETLMLNKQSALKTNSFQEFLCFNKSINFFVDEIEALFLGKVYTGLQFDIPGLLNNPIAIIEYTPLFIAIFIDIPYTIEHRNDSYMRVNHLSSNQDEYILNRLGLIVISFSEEQIVKNTLACYKYICRLIVRITGDINLLDDKINNQVPSLVKTQQWDIDNIARLKNQKYREEYLAQTDYNS